MLAPRDPSPSKSNSRLHELFPTLGCEPQWVGIVNCTPDSFSDGGLWTEPNAALSQIEHLVRMGAAAVDIGAESTRPGAQAVSAHEQWQRLEPIFDALSEAASLPLVVSIDTRSAEVAARALENGASIINDVSAGAFDPEILDVAAQSGCPIVLMHSRGTPASMARQSDYGAEDFIAVVCREMRSAIEHAIKRRVLPEQIIIDPGIGFAKTREQSQRLMANLASIKALGYPVFVGPSRKSFLRQPDEVDVSIQELDRRTQGAVRQALGANVEMIRVHNVAAARLTAQQVPS